jgi:hypothetical protein
VAPGVSAAGAEPVGVRGAVPGLLPRAPDRHQVRWAAVVLGAAVVARCADEANQEHAGSGSACAVGKVPGTERLCAAGGGPGGRRPVHPGQRGLAVRWCDALRGRG